MDDDLTEDKLRDLAKQLGRAAANNALQLVEEADLLDENGHKARAFALTVLAAEEMGKAFICSMTELHAIGEPHAQERDDWLAFSAMIAGRKRHETKLLGALFMIQKVGELSGEPTRQLAQELSDLTAGDLEAAKMRALYVDIEGGEIATPAKVADHEGAQLRARALRREVVGWAIAMGGGDESTTRRIFPDR